jgi:hypothetical protein
LRLCITTQNSEHQVILKDEMVAITILKETQRTQKDINPPTNK